MDDNNLKKLNEARIRLRKNYLESGNFGEVLNCLDQPKTQEERDLASFCHYELSKNSCVTGKFSDAKSHAVALEQLKPTSQVIRSLNASRLKLLNTPRYAIPADISCSPGIVSIPGMGDVPVLDKYVVYGHKNMITQCIHILKKAPEEMEENEIKERPKLIEALGVTLWNTIRQLSFSSSVDVLVPIPADPDRYSIRMYHPPDAIAKAISLWSAIPLEAYILHKTRETRSLRGLQHYERADEIKGSIAIDKGRQFVIKDRCVLLVDDVVTWGTHFREATRVLIQAGAGKVVACALASAHGELIAIKETLS